MVALDESTAKELVRAFFAATHAAGRDAEERALMRKEIGEELQAITKTRQEAEDLIESAKRSFDEFPTRREFRDFALKLRLARQPPPVALGSDNCSQCRGSGWARVSVEASGGVFLGLRYEAVKICPCRRLG